MYHINLRWTNNKSVFIKLSKSTVTYRIYRLYLKFHIGPKDYIWITVKKLYNNLTDGGNRDSSLVGGVRAFRPLGGLSLQQTQLKVRKTGRNRRISGKIINVSLKQWLPGPASSVEERTPINPAIRVRGEEFFVRDN